MCFRCGRPVAEEEEEVCEFCLHHKFSFLEGRGLWKHEPPIRDGVYRFKFSNQREYSKVFALELAKEFEAQIQRWNIECIIPIPIHKRRERKRGFNQSELLAKELGNRLDLPVFSGLQRKKPTKPQRVLNYLERKQNLQGAFFMPQGRLRVKNVLLIDDIFTTGSTLEEAAGYLKERGVERVYFLTLTIGQD